MNGRVGDGTSRESLDWTLIIILSQFTNSTVVVQVVYISSIRGFLLSEWIEDWNEDCGGNPED